MDVEKKKNSLRIAILAPITWRVPPRAYGPWERVVYNLTETLVKMGQRVTLFATGDSQTSANLESVIETPLGETPQPDPKVWETLHIANVFERASQFDLIHSHLNYTPLTYSKLVKTPLVTTLHGVAAFKETHPVFLKYKDSNFISISNFERSYLPELNYMATIYNGIDFGSFPFKEKHKNYLVYTGRICEEKGVLKAIKLSYRIKIPLYLAGIIPRSTKARSFFAKKIKPHIDGKTIYFLGNLSQKRVAQLIADALAYVFLISKGNKGEACPLSILEAFACGVPVIGSKNGPLPEIIKTGVNGMLVSSVSEVDQNLKKIKNLNRRRIRKSAEMSFSRKQMARNYLKCYRQLLKESEEEND